MSVQTILVRLVFLREVYSQSKKIPDFFCSAVSFSVSWSSTTNNDALRSLRQQARREIAVRMIPRPSVLSLDILEVNGTG